MSRRSDQLEAKKAIDLLRQEGNPLALAEALRRLGEIERSLPGTDGGVAAYEEAVALFRQQGEELKLAHTVRHLGDIQLHAGYVERAAQSYEMALGFYRRHPEAPPLDLANALRGMALLKEATGETQIAIALWQEATIIYESTNVTQGAEEGARRLSRLRQ